MKIDQIAGYIGKKTLISVDHILDLFAFAYRILILMLQRPIAGRALVRRFALEQVYFTSIHSFVIVSGRSLIN